jgi:hypothetical protein
VSGAEKRNNKSSLPQAEVDFLQRKAKAVSAIDRPKARLKSTTGKRMGKGARKSFVLRLYQPQSPGETAL